MKTSEMVAALTTALTAPAGDLSIDYIKANALLMKVERLVSDNTETRDLFFDIAAVMSCLHDHIKPSEILAKLERLEALEAMMAEIEKHYANPDMSHVDFRVEAYKNVQFIKQEYYNDDQES